MNTEISKLSPPLALIAGPTASGKSDFAVALANALEKRGKSARIINADSAQVYRDLQVLSARPSAEEMAGIPHLLFGEWDGASACSAADWAEKARAAVTECHANSAVPILVGGTGLYIRSLLEGIAPVPEIAPEVREAVRTLPQEEARRALEQEDPEAAARLAPADRARTCRALEVIRSTGAPLSHWQAQTYGGIGDVVALHPCILLPERAALFQNCDLRFTMMMERGAIEEVEALLARNLSPDLPIMRAIGVREVAAYIKGEISREQAIEAGQLATRQYAKRQYTWFRNQPPENWPKIASKNTNLEDIFERLLQF